MSELRPRVGAHYPRSAGEFRSWFGTDADCLDYLDWLRWPDGFVCPECGHHGGWRVADGRYKCASFGGRTSVTAGAAGHPSGFGRRSPPAELPRRVRLPVQSAPLPQPRHALLPGPGISRRAHPDPLPRPGRRPAAQKRPTQAALIAGSSPKFGPATGEPTLQNGLTCEGPVN
jgi:hypothetical protein